MNQATHTRPDGVIVFRWFVFAAGQRYVTWAESADAAKTKAEQFSTVRRLHQAIDRVEPAPALDGTA